MNTTELVKEIAAREGLTQTATEKVVKGMTEVIADALKAGDTVRIFGFGTFASVHKDMRVGHNPRTNEEMIIPEHNKAKFSEAKHLRDAINQ